MEKVGATESRLSTLKCVALFNGESHLLTKLVKRVVTREVDSVEASVRSAQGRKRRKGRRGDRGRGEEEEKLGLGRTCTIM